VPDTLKNAHDSLVR